MKQNQKESRYYINPYDAILAFFFGCISIQKLKGKRISTRKQQGNCFVNNSQKFPLCAQ
jgi:hypothetical protein